MKVASAPYLVIVLWLFATTTYWNLSQCVLHINLECYIKHCLACINKWIHNMKQLKQTSLAPLCRNNTQTPYSPSLYDSLTNEHIIRDMKITLSTCVKELRKSKTQNSRCTNYIFFQEAIPHQAPLVHKWSGVCLGP